MEQGLIDLAKELTYVLSSILLLFLGKITLNLLTPFKVDDEVSARDNPAFGLSIIGYYLGILIIFIGASYSFDEPQQSGSELLWTEILTDIAWTILGIALLNVARIVTDKVVLRKFSTRKEIIDDQNIGMGAVEFGVYTGSALVLAGAVSGRGGGLGTALAFFGLGQLGLIIMAWIYQFLTKYDFQAEIEKDNVAAGVAFGGNCIAMGIVLMRGTAGDFQSWWFNLFHFGWYFICAIILMVIGRLAIDYVLLPRRTLHQEIFEDRNVNAGYLEGGLLVGLAAVISVML